MLNWILRGLNFQGCSEVQLACCLGAAHLCSSTLLMEEVITTLLTEIIQKTDARNHYEVVCTVLIICEKQNGVLKEFPSKAFSHLVKSSTLVADLKAFAEKGGIMNHFMTLFVDKLSESM